jgi:tetratricopeptide (TPR) repeat protein
MNEPLRWVSGALALAFGLAIGAAALAQGGRIDQEEREAAADAQSTDIDAQTGRILNEAIELMNASSFPAAAQKVSALQLERLSPYERGRVEQILANIAVSQEKYGEAREHLQKAVDSGGLNAEEIDAARYQNAVLYIQEDKWREGAAALEEWFKTAVPNSAAYYLLAAAYYQLEDFGRALPPAQKAVELMDPAKPNENWLGMLSALYLQREEYREAIPVLEQLIAAAPDKKLYWTQLSSVHVQLEDYANGLAVLQLAHHVGLVTEDSEIRRLADLLVFNGVPYRGAQLLEAAIQRSIVALDDKLYEKLATCWIAAGELDRSVAPLQRAAALAPSGDTFVRLGELQAQRADWPAAIAAIQSGLAKGGLKDPGNAELWLGIAHYSQKAYETALPFFQRATQAEKHRPLADSYLRAIRAQITGNSD